MTTQAMFDEASVAAGLLDGAFTGRVHLPGEVEYDVQRRPLSGPDRPPQVRATHWKDQTVPELP
jgi:hypothetical protein